MTYTPQFKSALASKARYEKEVSLASAALANFPKLPNGLVPDGVKASAAYQDAKRFYDHCFGELRRFNGVFLRKHKAEYGRYMNEQRKELQHA